MGFFRKKNLDSAEYQKLANRITDCENQFDKLTSKFMSLRGLIHRKFTGDLQLSDVETAKENAIDDGFDELRKLNKEHGTS